MIANLDRFGRVVIPKRFRDDLGLEPGDAVEIEEGQGMLYLRPERTGSLVVREGVLVYQAQSTGSIDRAVDETREERLNKLGLSGA